MRFSLGVLYGVLCAAFIAPAGANVATTAGSNLTAYNGTGATNNNQWNSLMNARGGMAAPEANYGNCNAVILRCASPKCGSGCTDINIARPIVAGCVNSNSSCKKHGDSLIDYITAQLVAQSTAKANEQASAAAVAQAQAQAQADASAAAAAQSNAQMQQMQAQMQQMQAQMAESMNAMQQQMAAQSEAQNAQIQSALDAQRESMTAQTNAVSDTNQTGAVISGLEGLSVAEQLAAKNGISTDILVREQMGGKIETAVEDAMTAMKDLTDKLDAILEYAGCDPSVSGCTGPKRVKKFKDMANEFFDPYERVVENVYDALILAMTLGINVNDVVMLLSDSCNMWGKYLCEVCTPTKYSYDKSGNVIGVSAPANCECNDYITDPKRPNGCYYRVVTGSDGKVQQNQNKCRLVDIIKDGETVWREWIDANTGMTGSTQVACASDVVMSAKLFSSLRKKTNAKLDVDTLRRWVNQDSYSCRGKWDTDSQKFVLSGGKDAGEACGMNMCIVDMNDDSDSYKRLYNAVQNRRLPTPTVGTSTDENAFCYTDIEHAPRKFREPDVVEGDLDPIVNKPVYCAGKLPSECTGTCKWNGSNCVANTDDVVAATANCLKYNNDRLLGEARKTACKNDKSNLCTFNEKVWECELK